MEAKQGVLDLRDWDFAEHEMLKLRRGVGVLPRCPANA